MRKSLVISEQDSIAALLENDRVAEFFVNRGELLLGDIYTCSVENILPGIDAAFVNLGKDKMGFLHANDVPGQGPLKERLVPKQKLLVQITKEPTGHKGPRVSTAISLPGRFLVLVPEERGVSISRRISESRERARLKSVVNLMKPPGIGLIIRTEAKGQGEDELYEDFEQLWDTWQTIVSEAEESIGPTLIYRDQDLLYRTIRDAYSHEVTDIIVDSPDGQKRAQDFLKGWASKNTKVSFHTGEESLLVEKSIVREIEAALTDRAELPSGGHLNIQPTEALTVIDVNSGRFTSSRTQAETVRRTNLEAAQEIPRQLRLRNIGGMVIVDFIDMESRRDQQQVLEVFQRVLEEDRAKPQVGQLSDLGLVELTRRRQGQSLRELFTTQCSHCVGQGIMPDLVIGPSENRTAIVIKQDEDEPVARPAKMKALKSASATSSGRVISTLKEAPRDDQEEIPEDLLNQVPQDLLEPEKRSGDRRFKRIELPEDEEDENEEITLKVEGAQIEAGSALYEESISETEVSDAEADELARNISAVEEVYNELSRSGSEAEIEAVVVEEPASEEEEEVPGMSAEEAKEAYLEDIATASPHEAIEGPVTGVFTLKVREEDAHPSPAPASGFSFGSSFAVEAPEAAVEAAEDKELESSATTSFLLKEEREVELDSVPTVEASQDEESDAESKNDSMSFLDGFKKSESESSESYDQLKLATFASESYGGSSEQSGSGNYSSSGTGSGTGGPDTGRDSE